MSPCNVDNFFFRTNELQNSIIVKQISAFAYEEHQHKEYVIAYY